MDEDVDEVAAGEDEDEGEDEQAGVSDADEADELEEEDEDETALGSEEHGSSGEEEDVDFVESRGGEAGSSGRRREDEEGAGQTNKKRKHAADPESMHSLKKQLEDARKKRLKGAQDDGGADEAAGPPEAGIAKQSAAVIALAWNTAFMKQSFCGGTRMATVLCMPCMCFFLSRQVTNVGQLELLASLVYQLPMHDAGAFGVWPNSDRGGL